MHWTEILNNILSSIAIIGAALWTIFRFGIFRERFAKIEFNLSYRYIGKTDEAHIVELIATVENKGMVRQYIREWTFDLLLFKEGDPIDESKKKINFQVNFNEKKIDKRPWVPTTWYTTFIDSNTTQTYTYLTALPIDTKFFSIYSRFIYPESSDFHSSQKTFMVIPDNE